MNGKKQVLFVHAEKSEWLSRLWGKRGGRKKFHTGDGHRTPGDFPISAARGSAEVATPFPFPAKQLEFVCSTDLPCIGLLLPCISALLLS
jgi:hypothetical protein